MITMPSSDRATKTCAPWRPVSPKKTEANAPALVLNPTWRYSTNWVRRKARPIMKVSVIPARNAGRLPRLIDCKAQCIVKLEVTRIAVLTPATKTGNSYGAGGQGLGASGLTTRTKKETGKNEPKTVVSDG